MRGLIIVLLAVLLGVAVWRVQHREAGELGVAGPAPVVPVPKRSALSKVVFPTDQQGLLEEPRIGVFQPAASGDVQSALYGSVRTGQSGEG